MQQKINMIGPPWKGLKRFISDAQLHRMTLSELAMKNDPVTSAGIYKEGEKISFSGEGERGKKGKDKTEEGLIIKHCLSFKGTLHLVSVSRTVSWPKSLQGINFASYHPICGKTSPVPPHDSSILETLTTEIMLQTEKPHLSTCSFFKSETSGRCGWCEE